MRPQPHISLRLRLAVAFVIIALSMTAACQSGDLGKWFRRAKKAVEEGKKIKEDADKVREAFSPGDLTPEQEHYVGRSVAAKILGAYRPYNNPAANRYINVLGQTVARMSDRPETFKGYRFLLLDTDEVNAFAAPGGFIFVTRGLARCCPNEDALAAVLAHEVSHVQYKHSLLSIRSKRLTSVTFYLIGKYGSRLAGGDLEKVVESFSGSVDDVAKQLIQNKHSRATEVKTDQMMVTILKRIGYDPRAFLQALSAMEAQFKGRAGGFGTTHPAPAYRARVVKKAIGDYTPKSATPERAARFAKAMKGV